MKAIQYIALVASMISSFSCSNFDDLNTNPDTPLTVTPAMLATSLILNITAPKADMVFVYDNFLAKQLTWGGSAEPYVYNRFDRTTFESYIWLTNAKKMLDASVDTEKNAYEGLALFIKAYTLFNLSMQVGDIPYLNITGGEEGNIKAVYDPQEVVMENILKDLAQASLLFASANNFGGDPILKGDVSKWQKAVNAFRLKVLISLSNKEQVGTIHVRQAFAEIVSAGKLMESNDDNLQRVFSDKMKQQYPFYINMSNLGEYAIHSNMIINPLKKYNDYRLFYYASPSKKLVDNGKDPKSFDAFIGIDPSIPFATVSEMYANQEYCALNSRYLKYPAGEPYIFLGYAEQNFNLAEASLRGWISGNTSDYYKKGIEASLAFTMSSTPDNDEYHQGHKLTPEYITEYLQNELIQLTGNTQHQLEQIMEQKYLASFMQLPWTTYYDYRRTGLPNFPINPGTNMNTDKNKIPVRCMYPQAEYDYNKENVEAAVSRQYGGVDDVNAVMWILK